MILRSAWFSLFLVTTMTNAHATEEVDRFSTTVSKQVASHYLVVKPRDYSPDKKYPLLIFLHGRGEQGDDIDRVKIHGPFKMVEQLGLELLVIAPQSPQDERWDIDMLDAFVEEVIQKYPVDKNRIYLTGLSMGGEAVWRLAIRRPETFAAIAPICGGWSSPSQAERLRNVPVWAFHGAKDSTVLLQESKKMLAALEAFGADVRLTVYEDIAHASWKPAYKDPELYQWMMSHSKGK